MYTTNYHLKWFTAIAILLIILAAALLVAAPALAAPSCEYQEGTGWQILNSADHDATTSYSTLDECLTAVQVPYAYATLVSGLLTLTAEPTNTPEATQTVEPTASATVEPTMTPVVTQGTPMDPGGVELTEAPATQTPVPTLQPKKQGMSCPRAWQMIQYSVYNREVGFRYFDKHKFCPVWLMAKYGIDWTMYKIAHPLVLE